MGSWADAARWSGQGYLDGGGRGGGTGTKEWSKTHVLDSDIVNTVKDEAWVI